MVQNFQYDLTIRKTKTDPNRTKSVFLERWADIMKRDASLKTGQYAYTTDGRVINYMKYPVWGNKDEKLFIEGCMV